MPMIDVYSVEGTFADTHALARDLAAAVMRWEKVPELSLFKKNTAAFIHGASRRFVVECRRGRKLRPGTGSDSRWRLGSRQATRSRTGTDRHSCCCSR